MVLEGGLVEVSRGFDGGKVVIEGGVSVDKEDASALVFQRAEVVEVASGDGWARGSIDGV